MTNDSRAQEEVVTPTPQEPMPSSDQTGGVEPEVQPVDQATDVSDDVGDLPDGVSERTRQQFEKLKSQLAEARGSKSPFESIRQPQAPQAPVAPLYDPSTGYVDVNELENLRNVALEAQHQIAELKAERQRQDEERQTAEALSAYPELDPDAKNHDKELYEATLDFVVAAQNRGKTLTLKQAADRVKALSQKEVSKAEKAGATKALEELAPKEQAALEATGRSDRRVAAQDSGELIERTRTGDLGAIVARLKGIPPIN